MHSSVSENAVKAVFYEFNAAVVGSIVDADVVSQMIQFVMTFLDELTIGFGVLLPAQKEQQLINVHTRKVNRVAGPFVSKTNRMTLTQLGAIQVIQ